MYVTLIVIDDYYHSNLSINLPMRAKGKFLRETFPYEAHFHFAVLKIMVYTVQSLYLNDNFLPDLRQLKQQIFFS